MSSGPKSVTSTTSNEPPGFLLGPLTTAANAAQSAFTGGRPGGGFPGGVGGGTPFGGGVTGGPGGFGLDGFGGGGFPGQQGGLPGGVAGGPGAGLIGQGQNLISQTLGGDFLDPSTNPFLQSTFNRAADLTRGRLDTEFAGAGRNLGASQPARSEELQTLASNIFGQNFQAERDRQTNALASSQDFDPLNLLINRLAGIIPGAGGTITSTQPVFKTGIFSDRRLKTNIKRIGTVRDYPWYSFDYIWGESSEGFMSDEIPQQHVSQRFGFDVVDYGSIL